MLALRFAWVPALHPELRRRPPVAEKRNLCQGFKSSVSVPADTALFSRAPAAALTSFVFSAPYLAPPAAQMRPAAASGFAPSGPRERGLMRRKRRFLTPPPPFAVFLFRACYLIKKNFAHSAQTAANPCSLNKIFILFNSRSLFVERLRSSAMRFAAPFFFYSHYHGKPWLVKGLPR